MTSQIDLSKYVGKKVRIETAVGSTYEDVVLCSWNPAFIDKYKILGAVYIQDGTTQDSRFNIIHIEEIMKPEEIDLSKYVGKKVRVTFRNTVFADEGIVELDKGIVELTEWDTYPYRIRGNLYSKDGKWKNSYTKKYDILTIEEIQMNNYQELENKVKEMQAEIDRLKAQEQKQKEVRTFKDEIWQVLDRIRKQTPYSNDDNSLDDYTDKICEIVKRYIPVPQIEREDYDHGYNDAISKVKKNLGLNE